MRVIHSKSCAREGEREREREGRRERGKFLIPRTDEWIKDGQRIASTRSSSSSSQRNMSTLWDVNEMHSQSAWPFTMCFSPLSLSLSLFPALYAIARSFISDFLCFLLLPLCGVHVWITPPPPCTLFLPHVITSLQYYYPFYYLFFLIILVIWFIFFIIFKNYFSYLINRIFLFNFITFF